MQVSNQVRIAGKSGRLTPSASRSVILLAYTYPPENEIGAARPHRFARYLPEFGYQVKVFSSGIFQSPAGAPEAWRTERRVALWEKPVRKFLMPGEEGFSWIGPVEKAVMESAKREDYAAIISTAPPIAPHLAAGRLSRRLKIPWIADFRDPLAGSPIRKMGALQVLDPMLERWIVNRASCVTLCTNVAHEDFKRRYPDRADRFELLWNGFDPDHVFCPPASRLNGPRRLVHLGSLYDARTPNPLLVALASLIRKGRLEPDFLQVRLIGSLDSAFERQLPEVWSYLRQQGALMVTPTHQPQPVVQREMEDADGLLLVDMSPQNTGYTLPGKVFEYVPTGRPIVAMTSPGSPTEWVLKNSGASVVFLYAGAAQEELEGALLEWAELPRKLHEPNGWFWENFDGRGQVKTLGAMLDRIVRHPV